MIYAPPVQDYVEKFQIMYSTGDLPDVFVTAAENKGEVLDNDIAMDISYLPAFEKMSDKNKETYTKDGKIYAFAPDAWIAGIFYNKKILEDNGIAVPTNREEYLASMAALKANGIQPWAFCSTNLYDRSESGRLLWMNRKPGFFLKTAMPPLWKAILFFMSKMRICSPIL